MDDETAPESEHELYELIGVGFRLPVYVRFEGERWNKECVSVAIPKSMPLLRAQRRAIELTLGRAMDRRDQLAWILRRDTLSQWLCKSNHTDPQDVVVWNWTDPESVVNEDFVTAYCQHSTSVLKNKNDARFAWASFCKFMMHWMLHLEKPLHLGFARITAVPARSNWLAILHARYVIALRYVNFSEAKFKKKHLQHMTMTAFDERTQTIRWSLALESLPLFQSESCKVELERQRGVRKYPVHVSNLLKKHSHRMYEIFKAYLSQAAHPVLRLPQVKFGRAKRNGNKSGDVEAPTIAIDPPQPASGVFGVDRVLEPGAAGCLESENAFMLEVSDLQPAFENVRNGGNDLDQHENGQERTSRLRLPDVVEGEDARQLLEIRSDGRDDDRTGVANRTEQPAAGEQIP